MRRRRSLLLVALLLLLLLVGGGLFVALDGPSRNEIEEALQPQLGAADVEEPVGPVRGGRSERERRRVEPEVEDEAENPASGEADERERERSGTEEDDGPRTGTAPTPPDRPPTDRPSGDHPARRPVTKRAAGTVVDAATGEPVAGARIRYALIKGNMPAGWWGATSRADGSFEVLVRDSQDLADARRELIVDAAGYLVFRTGSPGEDVVARLERQTEPEIPGAITGVISHAPGKPVTGPVLIQSTGEYGSYAAQWVIAGEDGSFCMEGVPPRYWNLWTPAGRLPVLVPPGGEATTALTTTGNGDSAGGSGERRSVVVTGMPDEARDAATLRAEVKPRLFWRTVTAGGRATLGLPCGEWTLVLSWGVDQEIRRRLEVGPGASALEIDLGSHFSDEKRASAGRPE